MDDHRRQQILEQYEDAALSLLMDESAQAEGERLLDAFAQAQALGQVPDFPLDSDEKCQQLIDSTFKRQAAKESWSKFCKKSLQVAAVTIALLGVMATMVLKVEAIRVPVMNYLLEHCDRFSIMLFTDTKIERVEPLLDPVEMLSATIPEGYYLLQEQIWDASNGSVYYCNDKEEIIMLVYTTTAGTIVLDTEDCIITEMSINGYEATLLEKTSMYFLSLYWTDPEAQRVYTLGASGLTMDEFIHLATAVIP